MSSDRFVGTETSKQFIASKEFKKYRKKPVVVRAYLNTEKELAIATLEGVMIANVGDYIIEGVKGELYPCKPDVFKETYEEVQEE